MYTRSRGVQLSLSTRSLARSLAPGRGEETQARPRYEEKDSAICARGPQRCGTIAKRKRRKRRSERRRRGRSGTREEGDEGERSPGRIGARERIEQEAIRECLMPRTKLCNYLHVRLKTILTSARTRARARACAMLCAYLCPCVAPAQVIRRQAVRMCVYV